ncbi:hypothetical protein F5051DRAFT_450868 [Lentinula edodes]|nr:hypothetical protein F5051DRAFT_450868 [Lentinula edodes]
MTMPIEPGENSQKQFPYNNLIPSQSTPPSFSSTFSDSANTLPDVSPSSTFENETPASEVGERKTCSVRRCLQLLPLDSTKKMCENCRLNHRRYSRDKRLKRKLEKAALIKKILSKDGQGAPSEGSGVGHCATDDAEPSIIREEPETGFPAASPTVIPQVPVILDPRLLAPQSFPISSSALAGALGPTSFDINPSAHPAPLNDTHDSPPTPGVNDSVPKPMLATNEGFDTSRCCSIKGCTFVLSPDYSFKMCIQCRNRSKQQNVSNRRKWKAEGLASDQGVKVLQAHEDERRKLHGLPPLDDSPNELRAWEQSVVDGKAQLPLSYVTMLVGAAADPTNNPQPPTSLADDHVTGIVSEEPSDTSDPLLDSLSLGVALNKQTMPIPPADMVVTSSTPLPPHMCTVSHCRTVLPGTYLYKRCEKHRVQNRMHGRLRVEREKSGLLPGKGLTSATAQGSEGGIAGGTTVDDRDQATDDDDGDSDNDQIDEDGLDQQLENEDVASINGYNHNTDNEYILDTERRVRQHASKLMMAKIAADRRRENNRARRHKHEAKKVLTGKAPTKRKTAPSGAKFVVKGKDNLNVLTPEVVVSVSVSAGLLRKSKEVSRSEVDVAKINEMVDSPNDDRCTKPSANKKRKLSTCMEKGCMNLLNPHQRWRMCQSCRPSRENLRRELILNLISSSSAGHNEESLTTSEVSTDNVDTADAASKNSADKINSLTPTATSVPRDTTVYPYPYPSYHYTTYPHHYTYPNTSAMVVAPTVPYSNPYVYPYSYGYHHTSVSSPSFATSSLPFIISPVPVSASATSVSASASSTKKKRRKVKKEGLAPAEAVASPSSQVVDNNRQDALSDATTGTETEAMSGEPQAGSQTSDRRMDVDTNNTSSSQAVCEPSIVDPSEHTAPSDDFAFPGSLSRPIPGHPPATPLPELLDNPTKFIMVDGRTLASKSSSIKTAARPNPSNAHSRNSSSQSQAFLTCMNKFSVSPQPNSPLMMNKGKSDLASTGDGSTLGVFSVSSMGAAPASSYGIFKVSAPSAPATSQAQAGELSTTDLGMSVASDLVPSVEVTPVEDSRKRNHSEVESEVGPNNSSIGGQAKDTEQVDQHPPPRRKRPSRAKKQEKLEPEEATTHNTYSGYIPPSYMYSSNHMHPSRYYAGYVSTPPNPSAQTATTYIPLNSSPASASTSPSNLPTPATPHAAPTYAYYPPHSYMQAPGYHDPYIISSPSSYPPPYTYPYSGLYTYPSNASYTGYGASAYPGYPAYPSQSTVYCMPDIPLGSNPSKSKSKYAEVLETRATMKSKEKVGKGNKPLSGEGIAPASGDVPENEVEAKTLQIETRSGPPVTSSAISERICHTKSCRRAIPQDVSGNLCSYCRARFKKHQLRAKQRFKLEPRKVVVGVLPKPNKGIEIIETSQ